MVRILLRLIVLVVLIVAAAAFFLGYRGSGQVRPADSTTTVAAIREKTAEAAHETAEAATKAGEYVSDGALTAKITSKMALDDSVRARSIDVTTKDHVVTLSGTVRSVPEHDRAVQLARETDGITRVVDNLKVAVSVSR